MINTIKANLHFLSLIVLLVLFIIIKIPYLSLPYYWDEAWVYGPALRIMAANHLSILPDALPVDYSRGHPLLFHFMGALWLRIFGTSLLSSHIFALTVSIALLLMIYYFCKAFFSKKIGLIACFIILFLPIFQAQSVLVLPEIMLALFSLMAIYFFLKKKWIGYIIAGTCAILTKETGIVVIGTLCLWFFLSSIVIKKEKINLGLFISRSAILLIPLVVFSIFLIIQKQTNGWYFFPEHLHSMNTAPFEVFKNIIKRAVDVYIYNGKIVLFITLIISLFFYFRQKKYYGSSANEPLIIFAIFSAFYLLICALNFYSNRYSISILIPFVIAASFFITNLFTKKTDLFVLIICLLSFPLAYGFQNKIASDCNLKYTNDIKTNSQMVQFCVDNKFQSKKIFANFLMAANLSNPYCGYLSERQKFSHISSKIDANTELFIFSCMEQLEDYKKIKSTLNIRLLKRFESKNSWTEIYEPVKPLKQ